MGDIIDACLTLSSSKHFRIRSYDRSPMTSPSSNMAAATSSCCRCLFGRPDAEEVRLDLELIRRDQLRRSVERWNYDFASGRPLVGKVDWGCRVPVRTDAAEEENCDGGVEDQQLGGGRLEQLESSPNSVQSASAAAASTTTTNSLPLPQQNIITTTTVNPPRAPTTIPPDAGRKRRRSSPRSDGTAMKQSRHHGRRKKLGVSGGRHGPRSVTTAGAARVTGQYKHSCTKTCTERRK